MRVPFRSDPVRVNAAAYRQGLAVRLAVILPFALVLSGCAGDGADTVDAVPALGPVADLSSPAGGGSGEPFLFSSASGGVLMSWLEPGDTSYSLRFARLVGTVWSEPRTIAASSIFFVNWADFPSIIELAGGRLAAHWLERSGPGTYAYDVWIAFSNDDGLTWSEPVRPHDDGTLTEHGFVSLFEMAGAPAAVWLDGRNYADRDGSPATREMTVRFAAFDGDGRPVRGSQIDARACDCCQTDVAIASSGPILAYRDRSTDEIRDIAITRLVDGEWTESVPVHDDGWHIAACPVNGPAMAADEDRVAVAWFTAAQDTARVRVAFSDDSGATFGEPVRADLGMPAGRVDVLLLDESRALVSWLERADGSAKVIARTVSADGTMGEPVTIGGSSAERASGFPRMTRDGDRIVFAWTVPGEPASIQVAALPIARQAPPHPYGREVALHEVLDERIEDHAQRARADPRRIRLPSGSEVAHRAGDRLADRLRGEDDHRGARERESGVGAAADAGDDEGGARGLRAQSAGMPARWEALPPSAGTARSSSSASQRPAAPMAWSFLFDIVHHRGQITTYLRPMGSTVPQIYGPSGDEPDSALRPSADRGPARAVSARSRGVEWVRTGAISARRPQSTTRCRTTTNTIHGRSVRWMSGH
jgi:hypothetical protein